MNASISNQLTATNNLSLNHGYIYKAFVHGYVNNNYGKVAAVSMSIVMYTGLAALGYVAATYFMAFKASVAFTSALLFMPNMLNIGASLALPALLMIWLGTRTINIQDPSAQRLVPSQDPSAQRLVPSNGSNVLVEYYRNRSLDGRTFPHIALTFQVDPQERLYVSYVFREIDGQNTLIQEFEADKPTQPPTQRFSLQASKVRRAIRVVDIINAEGPDIITNLVKANASTTNTIAISLLLLHYVSVGRDNIRSPFDREPLRLSSEPILDMGAFYNFFKENCLILSDQGNIDQVLRNLSEIAIPQS